MPTQPPKHRATQDKRESRNKDVRLSACRRGYGRSWQRIRLAYLRANPLCVWCEKSGLLTPAYHVDHILAITKGGTHDESNLQSLCHSCHSSKTVEMDGALGHRPSAPQSKGGGVG